MRKNKSWALALIASAALSACGGGDDDSTTPLPASSITITGSADKGTAMANAAIGIKCATGNATGTAGADGSFSVPVSGATLPCAVQAVGTDGTVLHSVAAGPAASGSQVANATPLTELMVAQIAGTTPAAYYSSFGAGSTLTPATLAAAADYVKVALAGTTDLTGVNPATAPPSATLDAKIDAVVAGIAASNTTLAAVAAAVAANPAAPAVVASPLAPAATDCAWLKSGKYRLITPSDTDPAWKAQVGTIDAVARTVRSHDGSSAGFTSNGGCLYTIDDATETNKIMVSSAGLLVVYSQSKTNAADRWVTVGMPEQTLPVSEFAGTWNVASWDTFSATSSTAATEEFTFNASGQLTAESNCLGLAACVPRAGVPASGFVANATSGGFDFTEGGTSVGRGFLFKSALTGKAVLVFVSNDGTYFAVGTRKEAIGTLPAVGSVSNFHEFNLNGNGTLSNLVLDQSVSVTAVDATTRNVTRLRASDNRVDTLAYDKPRDGLRYRAPNSCTVGGVASNCAATVQFPLQGMGITLSLSVGTNPATAFYSVSIGKPN